MYHQASFSFIVPRPAEPVSESGIGFALDSPKTLLYPAASPIIKSLS